MLNMLYPVRFTAKTSLPFSKPVTKLDREQIMAKVSVSE